MLSQTQSIPKHFEWTPAVAGFESSYRFPWFTLNFIEKTKKDKWVRKKPNQKYFEFINILL